MLFSDPAAWESYRDPLTRAFAAADLAVDLRQDAPPDAVDYIITSPASPLTDFRPYRRVRAVLNLWAGVEGLEGNGTLTMPLARLVDPDLTQGMVEWVTGHVLRHHLGMDAHLHGQDGLWRDAVPPLARDRTVGILGLGELGRAAALALARIGFRVAGWSRAPRDLDGVATRHGPDGLADVLSRAEILVLLLPLTDATRGLIDADALARLPRGAVLVNPGRGRLIDDAALLAALDSGHLAHTTLDVFRTEPLPAEHPFWAHPRVTVTPHIAAATRPDSAARSIAANIARAERGEPLTGRVDRLHGY